MKISGKYNSIYNKETQSVDEFYGEIVVDVDTIYCDVRYRSGIDLSIDIALFLAWLPTIKEIVISYGDELYITFENCQTIEFYNETLGKLFLDKIERQMKLNN